MIYFTFLFLKIPQILVKQFVSVHFTHNYYYYIYYLHVSLLPTSPSLNTFLLYYMVIGFCLLCTAQNLLWNIQLGYLTWEDIAQ